MKNSSFGDFCCKIDAIHHRIKECSYEPPSLNGLEEFLIGSVNPQSKNEEIEAYNKLLDESPIDEDQSFGILKTEGSTPTQHEISKIELMTLP